MKRATLFWIVALLVTIVSAVFQRMTGPTYPLSGTVHLGTITVPYKLSRSQGGGEGALVRVPVSDSAISGIVEWRRYKSDDLWTPLQMQNNGGMLEARLPPQPPAGKLEYRVVLTRQEQQIVLPKEGTAVIRYKGDVPTAVLVIHVAAMFAAMLLSTRTGLEFFNPVPQLRGLTYWTIGSLAFGGLIMGPLVQKFAFDAYWTGWPFGTDLTDNKTLLGLVCWIAVAISLKRSRKPGKWALGASILLLVIYLIPHSVLGSELDYRQTKSQLPRVTETNK